MPTTVLLVIDSNSPYAEVLWRYMYICMHSHCQHFSRFRWHKFLDFFGCHQKLWHTSSQVPCIRCHLNLDIVTISQMCFHSLCIFYSHTNSIQCIATNFTKFATNLLPWHLQFMLVISLPTAELQKSVQFFLEKWPQEANLAVRCDVNHLVNNWSGQNHFKPKVAEGHVRSVCPFWMISDLHTITQSHQLWKTL